MESVNETNNEIRQEASIQNEIKEKELSTSETAATNQQEPRATRRNSSKPRSLPSLLMRKQKQKFSSPSDKVMSPATKKIMDIKGLKPKLLQDRFKEEL